MIYVYNNIYIYTKQRQAQVCFFYVFFCHQEVDQHKQYQTNSVLCSETAPVFEDFAMQVDGSRKVGFFPSRCQRCGMV